jgi:hypothetical protein
MTHTPGPWEPMPYPANCGKDYEGKWWVRGPAGAEGFTSVADLARYGPEAEANARLIAAAPELLEAAIEAEEQSRSRKPVRKATWLKLCDAIKKANVPAP